MAPIAKPGPMTERERFMFETTGYLVIPGALSADEVRAALDASRRAHEPLGTQQWRQIPHLHETEPAIEALLDHPSVLPKARALLGDYFVVGATFCTMQPGNSKAGGYHQDGSGVYEFRRLGTPTPLVQLRIGYFLTDQSRPDMGNMVMIPGSQHSPFTLPKDLVPDEDDLPIREPIIGKAGDALIFHQGVYHRTGVNHADFDRYIMHVVYAPPWLAFSDRLKNDPAFLERTTPLRRALLGEWTNPSQPFGMGYPRPPFKD